MTDYSLVEAATADPRRVYLLRRWILSMSPELTIIRERPTLRGGAHWILRGPAPGSGLHAVLGRLRAKIDDVHVLSVRRQHSERELQELPWLRVMFQDAQIDGPYESQSAYVRQNSCDECGEGAVPPAPLLCDVRAIGKRHVVQTYAGWDLIVSTAVRQAMERDEFTGVQFHAVRGRRLHDDDHWWARTTYVWPPARRLVGFRVELTCQTCGLPSYTSSGEPVVEDIEYGSEPSVAPDLGRTAERFGYFGSPPVGANHFLIISSRCRELFRKFKVRAQYFPLTFVGEPRKRRRRRA